MEIKFTRFKELSLDELYEICRLRELVFHLEQKVTDEDFDNMDQISYHGRLLIDNKLVAYLRFYVDENNPEIVHIGRFLCVIRRKGYGRELFKSTLTYIEKELKVKQIVIHAQTYVKKLYLDLGFKEVGDTFLEAGIEHIKMIKYL